MWEDDIIQHHSKKKHCWRNTHLFPSVLHRKLQEQKWCQILLFYINLMNIMRGTLKLQLSLQIKSENIRIFTVFHKLTWSTYYSLIGISVYSLFLLSIQEKQKYGKIVAVGHIMSSNDLRPIEDKSGLSVFVNHQGENNSGPLFSGFILSRAIGSVTMKRSSARFHEFISLMISSG